MAGLHYKTLRENIVEEIRLRIVNQELPPGTKIVEMELAKEFQTSRAPIREALRQLENEGLVEYIRNAGCSVKNITIKDAYEIYLMRSNYETMAVKIMNGKIPAETIENMEKILEKMKTIDEEHYLDVFRFDNELHGELVKMVDLPRLYKAWEILNYGNVITSRTKNLEKSKVVKRQFTPHKELVDACKEENCEKLCNLISIHYWRTIKRLLEEEGVPEESISTWNFPI